MLCAEGRGTGVRVASGCACADRHAGRALTLKEVQEAMDKAAASDVAVRLEMTSALGQEGRARGRDPLTRETQECQLGPEAALVIGEGMGKCASLQRVDLQRECGARGESGVRRGEQG